MSSQAWGQTGLVACPGPACGLVTCPHQVGPQVRQAFRMGACHLPAAGGPGSPEPSEWVRAVLSSHFFRREIRSLHLAVSVPYVVHPHEPAFMFLSKFLLTVLLPKGLLTLLVPFLPRVPARGSHTVTLTWPVHHPTM